LERYFGLMARSMKVTGIRSMKVTGITTKCMERAFLSGQMVESMRETMLMIRNMVLGV